MPSRNRSVNTCELASFSPNETASLTDCSDIADASHDPTFLAIAPTRANLKHYPAQDLSPALPQQSLRHSCRADTRVSRDKTARSHRCVLNWDEKKSRRRRRL